ncbi:MAG TPA: hypothetical protein PKE07_06455 [Lacibacter sp.]|nr:hypothetical protein [Lacibacter sp.]HMO89168.1 hypothetical protein [Lacibacter sp.]
MKVQELLAPYLYQYKQLTLPGIGTFELDPSVNVSELKDENWPENTIRFSANAQAQADEAFLAYLVEHSGKMKILALSDLESYISNGLQLLNIGKPFQLRGIGLISKNSSGEFSFIQGTPAPEKGDVPGTSYVLKDRTRRQEEEKNLDFSSEERKSSRKPFLVIGILLALGLIAWAIFLALPQKERNEFFEDQPTGSGAAPADTTSLLSEPQPATDTAVLPMPEPVPAAAPAAADTSTGFRLLIQSFTGKEAAQAKFNNLKNRGHRVELQTPDSTRYLLVLLVNRPLQDTTYVRDSLKRWYLWNTKLITN